MPADGGEVRRDVGARESLGAGAVAGRGAQDRRCGAFAVAGSAGRHGEFSRGAVRKTGEAGAADDVHAGQDVLRRRDLLHARPRLQADRRHLSQGELSGLHLARVRRARKPDDGTAEEPGALAEHVQRAGVSAKFRGFLRSAPATRGLGRRVSVKAYYTAVRRFDSSVGAEWDRYLDWSKLPHLRG